MTDQPKLELPEVERSPRKTSPRVQKQIAVPLLPPDSFDSLQSRLTKVITLRQTFESLKDKKTKDSKDDLDALSKLQQDHELLLKNKDSELAAAKQKVLELESVINSLKVDYATKKVLLVEKTSKYTAAVEILDSKIAAAVKEISELQERLKEFEKSVIDEDLSDLPEELRNEAMLMSQSLIGSANKSIGRPTPIKISEELTTLGPEEFEPPKQPKISSVLSGVLSDLKKSPLLEKARQREEEREREEEEREQAEVQKTSRKKKAPKKSKTTSKFNDVLKEDRGEISEDSSSEDDDNRKEGDDGNESEDLLNEVKPMLEDSTEPAKKKAKVEKEFTTPNRKKKDAEDQDQFEFKFKKAEDAEDESFSKFEFELGGSLAFLNPDDDVVYSYESRKVFRDRYLVVIKKSAALKILKQAFKYQTGAVCTDHKKNAYKNFWDHYNYGASIKEVEQEVLVEVRETRGNDCQLCCVSIKKGEVCAYGYSFHEGAMKAKCTKHPLHVHCAAFLQTMMKEDFDRPCCIGNCYDSNNRDLGGKVPGCLLKN